LPFDQSHFDYMTRGSCPWVEPSNTLPLSASLRSPAALAHHAQLTASASIASTSQYRHTDFAENPGQTYPGQALTATHSLRSTYCFSHLRLPKILDGYNGNTFVPAEGILKNHMFEPLWSDVADLYHMQPPQPQFFDRDDSLLVTNGYGKYSPACSATFGQPQLNSWPNHSWEGNCQETMQPGPRCVQGPQQIASSAHSLDPMMKPPASLHDETHGWCVSSKILLEKTEPMVYN
jgi:hypothetical protein